MTRLVPVFDVDGTLLDSDEALIAPFVALGVVDLPPFGLVMGDACDAVGISVEDYVRLYDTAAALPFPGVFDLLNRLDRWAICSNKHPSSGHDELSRLDWKPEVAMFTDAFGGPKRLGPVLEAMALEGRDVIFIGDTAHDRSCARDAGAQFALAGWNPRAESVPGDVVLTHPLDLLEILDEKSETP